MRRLLVRSPEVFPFGRYGPVRVTGVFIDERAGCTFFFGLVFVYISVFAVTAANGFAFTASHLEEPQVTKGSCPFRSVAR
ncbi:hypothetical protein EMIT0P44_550024 [Pseudomonas sp. IT-P44]